MNLRLARIALALALVLAGGTILGGAGQTADVADAADPIEAYVPITPTRVVDTRLGLGGGRLSPGGQLSVDIRGEQAVGDTAVAVALNVTAVRPSGPGFLTVYPSGGALPETSNLNYFEGDVVPNLVTVGIGANGRVEIYSLAGTDLVVDIVGWYVAGFNPVEPARLMDTREGLGGFVLGPGETRDLVVQGRGGLPAAGVGAVALNVTAVRPTAFGHVTVWPTGRPQPTASNLNYEPGTTRANSVIVGLGSGGQVSLFNSHGETELVVDVAGWFDVGFDPVTPTRLMDTREGLNGVTLTAGETRNLQVLGSGGVPLDDVGAVSLNVTAVRPSQAGFLTLWPAGRDIPTASNVNFGEDQTVANAVVVGVGDAGEISIYNSHGSTDVVVDITGWYAQSDAEPPVLESFSVAPTSINTDAADQVVTATARITDDLSGNAGAGYTSSPSQIRFRSPTGNQFVTAMLSAEFNLVSGTPLDGMYEFDMTLPRFSESGTWTIESILLVDQVGNQRWFDATEAALAGYTANFSVN